MMATDVKTTEQTERSMRITAIAPWFGAKRTLAPRIVELLGPHTSYWEPFCGSMAVLLAKPVCSMETVNDLHGDLINLARTIADQVEGPRLYRWLRRTLMVEDLHRQAKSYLQEEFATGTERAYWYFLSAWMGMNGVAGTKSYNNGFCVRYSSRGGNGGVRTLSAIDSIPAWRRRLRRVMILNKNGFDLLKRVEDSSGTVIYVDPPYIEKGAKYVHEFEDDDHQRLADILHGFRLAQIILSYYDHPQVHELYPDYQIERIAVTKSLASGGRRGHVPATAHELILMNHRRRSTTAKGLFTSHESRVTDHEQDLIDSGGSLPSGSETGPSF